MNCQQCCQCTADFASVDNLGATVWDYARARQLHYCLLIIASYIRQRAKEQQLMQDDGGGGGSGGGGDGGEEVRSMMGRSDSGNYSLQNTLDDLGINNLQVRIVSHRRIVDVHRYFDL